MTPIRLQERDLDMLHSLSIGRYLTVQALEWLHFPTWRERWRRHQLGGNGAYYPLPNVYRRLEGLRAGGLAQTIRRSVERAALTFNRLADVYALTEAGAELLAERRGLDDLDYSDARQRSLQNLEHSVAIATIYAALRAELEYVFAERERRLCLENWRGDHLLARSYDRLDVPGEREKLPVLPDATFQLALGDRSRRYFVEVDRGTRPLDSWREKTRAYERYRGSSELTNRYAVTDFILLVVAPTARRMQRIAETIAKVQPQPTLGYLFIESAQAHPLTIRTGFRSIADVRMQTQVVAGNVVQAPTVTLVEHALWMMVNS
jgi:DNA-binding PadR family transcriptional regulator